MLPIFMVMMMRRRVPPRCAIKILRMCRLSLRREIWGELWKFLPFDPAPSEDHLCISPVSLFVPQNDWLIAS
jgi:hypothetical protein